jgi:hypothetical protein
MFKCCVYVFNGPDNGEEAIRAGLKKIARDCEDSEWFSFFNKLNAQYGLPAARVRAWAGWKPDDDWFVASDTYTENTANLENLTETAKLYSRIFGETALVMCVCDSDCSYITFADTDGRGFSRIGGRWDGYAEQPDGEMLSAPDFLREYMDENDAAELSAIWKKDFVFEEDRLDKISGMLHAPTFYFDPDETEDNPKDVEFIEEDAD